MTKFKLKSYTCIIPGCYGDLMWKGFCYICTDCKAMYRESLPTDRSDEKAEVICYPRHPDSINDLEAAQNTTGVYKLYDAQKNLLYIGKSYKLGIRIVSSGRARKATYYNYAPTKTRTDTDIYELYYIGIEKPPYNASSVHDDGPTITIPSLEFTEIKQIFKDVKEDQL